jgi:hypothetical protein
MIGPGSQEHACLRITRTKFTTRVAQIKICYSRRTPILRCLLILDGFTILLGFIVVGFDIDIVLGLILILTIG